MEAEDDDLALAFETSGGKQYKRRNLSNFLLMSRNDFNRLVYNTRHNHKIRTSHT